MRPLVVVGSLNADLLVPVARLPVAGETLAGRDLSVGPGGKGANQAAAAARLGAPVRFIGQVGDDVHGPLLRRHLAETGVDVAGVATVPGASGQALILLQDNGDNSIILIGGANRSWTGVPQAMTTALHGAGMLLLQREIPEAINRAAIRAAHAAGVPVLLDAGGDEGSLPADLLADLALLSPNETELARLTGLPTATDAQVETAARTLLAQDVRAVLVKLGARGSLLVRPGQAPLATPSFRVPVVDTTGAGDCFTAAYAVGRVAGLDDHTALRRASAAAAWCVTQRGALTAMPTTTQVEEILAGQKGPSA